MGELEQESRPGTEITFLGTDAVVPECGRDTASFVINRTYLVDTGWYAAIKMRCYGIDPMGLEYLFLTHCHHDHYIGLPHLLFYLAMRAAERPDREPLKIVGPAEDLERVVTLAQAFLQMERFGAVQFAPKLIPLEAGATYDDPNFQLTTCRSVHPVPALCYRFTDRRTGREFAFTGDTAYDPGIVRHVAGASLLIHEASYGASPTPANNFSLHSSALDAARVAIEAGVGRLALVHCPQPKQAAALEAARAQFPNTFWPHDGETIVV
jgi:ribonuclease Z